MSFEEKVRDVVEQQNEEWKRLCIYVRKRASPTFELHRSMVGVTERAKTQTPSRQLSQGLNMFGGAGFQ